MSPAARRARADIRLGRAMAIGDEWLRVSDETVWRVRQLHRADCRAELTRDGTVLSVPFGDLRHHWKRVLATPIPDLKEAPTA